MNPAILMLAVSTILQDGEARNASENPLIANSAGFSVTMPGPVTEEFQIASGSFISKLFDCSYQNCFYTIICLQDREIPLAQTDNFLGGVTRGYVRSINGTLISENKITFRGEKAREILVKSPDGIVYSMHFTKGKLFYQIRLTTFTTIDERRADFRRFADSFHFIAQVGHLTDGMNGSTTWNDFRINQGSFSIKIFGEPKVTTQTPAKGGMVVDSRTIEFNGLKGEQFSVIYGRIDRSNPSQSAVILLDKLAKEAAANQKGTIESSTILDDNGKTEAEVLIALPPSSPIQNGVCKLRLLLINERFFQMSYVGPRNGIQSKEVVGFFQSFRID